MQTYNLQITRQMVNACSETFCRTKQLQEQFNQFAADHKKRQQLVRAALREGLICILYKNLLKCGLEVSWDPATLSRLERLYNQNLSLNLQRLHDLKQLLDRMADAGIEPVLLQGVSMLQQVYEDVGQRMLTDIDLWLPGTDEPLVTRTLSGLGYRRYRNYPHLYQKRNTVVDVHYHLLWEDRLRSGAYLIKGDASSILRSARRIQIDGQPARLLGRADELFYLTMHLIKHRADRLIWLLDLQRLTAGWIASDWHAWRQHCTELGQPMLPVYLAYMLDQNLCRSMPGYAARIPTMPGLNSLQCQALKQRKKKGALPLWAPYILYSTGTGLKGRLSYAVEALFPRPEVLRQMYPDLPKKALFRLYLWRSAHIGLRLLKR